MSTVIQVARLRSRAEHLRTMSNAIATSRALGVYGLAGPETWVGPTAQACYDALGALRRQLQAQQQSLVDAARLFEQRADELEKRPPTLSTVS